MQNGANNTKVCRLNMLSCVTSISIRLSCPNFTCRWEAVASLFFFVSKSCLLCHISFVSDLYCTVAKHNLTTWNILIGCWCEQHFGEGASSSGVKLMRICDLLICELIDVVRWQNFRKRRRSLLDLPQNRGKAHTSIGDIHSRGDFILSVGKTLDQSAIVKYSYANTLFLSRAKRAWRADRERMWDKAATVVRSCKKQYSGFSQRYSFSELRLKIWPRKRTNW